MSSIDLNSGIDLNNCITIGRIISVHGVRGWVKILSHTSPRENLFSYTRWLLADVGGLRPAKVLQWQRQGKGFMVLLEGSDSRETAQEFCGIDIVVDKNELPNLTDGEFYWHQLEGLEVWCDFEEKKNQLLGVVDHLIETGSNDVLVVKASAGSIDKKDRMIPYLPGSSVIQKVDLSAGIIRVEWDPEF